MLTLAISLLQPVLSFQAALALDVCVLYLSEQNRRIKLCFASFLTAVFQLLFLRNFFTVSGLCTVDCSGKIRTGLDDGSGSYLLHNHGPMKRYEKSNRATRKSGKFDIGLCRTEQRKRSFFPRVVSEL